MTKRLIDINGKIEKVFFKRPGFSAGLISTNKKLIKFAGNLYAKKKRPVILNGFFENGDYGEQFIVDHVKIDSSMDHEGLIRYLAICPEAKGIGPSKAEKIVNKFQDDFEERLLKNHEEITSSVNLPKESLSKLKQSWKLSYGWNEVYSHLAVFDLTYRQIKYLVDNLKNDCIYFLDHDPYKMINLTKGLGFVKIDEIALKLGFDKKLPSRLLEGIKHSMNTYLNKGHCWTELEDLKATAMQVLYLDDVNSEDIIDNAINKMLSENILFNFGLENGERAIGFSKTAEREKDLFEIFVNQTSNPNREIFRKNKLESLLEKYNLNNNQRKAVEAAFETNVSIISGGAGTGKTYTLKVISQICKDNKLKVIMAAPTGKAARRIEEVTGVGASTIHRLLNYNGINFKHQKKKGFDLNCNVLIVDEVSMIDVNLFWHLFQSINFMKTSVVLVGDHNQLPPVGPGNVLRDLMTAEPIAITVLTEVMRQAGILKENSSAILDGKVRPTPINKSTAWLVEYKYNDPMILKLKLFDLLENYIPKLGFNILKDVQILSPTHKGPLGTTQLNLDIRELIQKKLFGIEIKTLNHPFLVNDKVIQTVNDYKNDIMNGEIGFVKKVKFKKEKLEYILIKFNNIKRVMKINAESEEINNLQLAYCLSIHKVQGSQFPCIISIIHKNHNYIHHRNLLYTAVTRAEKTSIILGDKWGIQNCVNKIETSSRKTFLSLYMPPLNNSKRLGGNA